MAESPHPLPPTRSQRLRITIASRVIACVHALTAFCFATGVLLRIQDPRGLSEAATHSPFYLPFAWSIPLTLVLVVSVALHAFAPYGRGRVRIFVAVCAHVLTGLVGAFLGKFGIGLVASMCPLLLVIDWSALIVLWVAREAPIAPSAEPQPSNNVADDARAGIS